MKVCPVISSIAAVITDAAALACNSGNGRTETKDIVQGTDMQSYRFEGEVLKYKRVDDTCFRYDVAVMHSMMLQTVVEMRGGLRSLGSSGTCKDDVDIHKSQRSA